MVEQFEQQFFSPSNPLQSDLLGDKFFILFLIVIGIMVVMAEVDAFKVKSKNKETSNEEVKKTESTEKIDSIENNDSNVVSEAIKEALKPTPIVYDTPVVNMPQSDANGKIKRVTTTVVEYVDAPTENTPAQNLVRVKCPACGSINNIPENETRQCYSCYRELHAMKV